MLWKKKTSHSYGAGIPETHSKYKITRFNLNATRRKQLQKFRKEIPGTHNKYKWVSIQCNTPILNTTSRAPSEGNTYRWRIEPPFKNKFILKKLCNKTFKQIKKNKWIYYEGKSDQRDEEKETQKNLTKFASSAHIKSKRRAHQSVHQDSNTYLLFAERKKAIICE